MRKLSESNHFSSLLESAKWPSYFQVEFVENTDTDWYGIRDFAQETWPKMIKGLVLEGGGSDAEMQITMVIRSNNRLKFEL